MQITGTGISPFDSTTSMSIAGGQTAVGAVLNIGTNASRVGPINIGVSGCAVNINGATTFNASATAPAFNNGLTLATNKYITATAPSTAPTLSSQIGYNFRLTNFYTVVQPMTSGLDYTVVNMTNFTAGTWLINGSTAVSPSATNTIQYVNVSITQGGLNISSGGNYAVNTTLYPFISGVFFSNGSTTLQIIYRIVYGGAGTPSITAGQTNFYIYATRIA